MRAAVLALLRRATSVLYFFVVHGAWMSTSRGRTRAVTRSNSRKLRGALFFMIGFCAASQLNFRPLYRNKVTFPGISIRGERGDLCLAEADTHLEKREQHMSSGYRFASPSLVVELSHGLGNRLRALASAAGIAQQTGRRLVVVWEPDVHLRASHEQLFVLEDVEEWVDRSFLSCAQRSPAYVVYDFLAHSANNDRVINTSQSLHIYVRTAFVFFHDLFDEETADLTYQTLKKFKPSVEVKDSLRRMRQNLWDQHHVDVADTLAVHIRMQGDLAQDVPGILSLQNNDPHSASMTMKSVANSRQLCHYRYFAANVERYIKTNKSVVAVVAADTNEASAALKNISKSNVFIPHLPEHQFCTAEFARVGYCVQLAFAEMLLLSEANSFLFSSASSFSELIAKIGSFPGGKACGCITHL